MTAGVGKIIFDLGFREDNKHLINPASEVPKLIRGWPMPAEQPNYDLIYSFARKMVFMASKHIDSKRQSNQMKTKELQYGGKKYDEHRNVSKLKYDNLIFYGRR